MEKHIPIPNPLVRITEYVGAHYYAPLRVINVLYRGKGPFIFVDLLTTKSSNTHVAVDTYKEIELAAQPKKEKKIKSDGSKRKRRRIDKTNEEVVAEHEIRKHSDVWPSVNTTQTKKPPENHLTPGINNYFHFILFTNQ